MMTLGSLVFSLVTAQIVVSGTAAAVVPGTAAAVPSPCPSSSPAPAGLRPPIDSPAPIETPRPCAAALATIGHVISIGRNANLVGSALSASTGSISQAQVTTRPLLRPGEVLEDIPGLVISQHSGGGKANQYYLRGFQLDHGTNLEAEINGVPINLGTHAHGQGYSDINYLLPELVSYVEFKKGTYFANQGDFAVAGGYSLFYRNTIQPTSSFTIGDFGYDRFFTANSIGVGTGSNLLYGAEIEHDNGSYVRADESHRFNGLLRYSHTSGPTELALTGMAYNGAFNSTDQIPQRLVDASVLSRYGYIDPTDGGNTYRYAISGQLTQTDPRGATKSTSTESTRCSISFELHVFTLRRQRLLQRHGESGDVQRRVHDVRSESSNAKSGRARLVADGGRRRGQLGRRRGQLGRRRARDGRCGIGTANDEVSVVLSSQQYRAGRRCAGFDRSGGVLVLVRRPAPANR